MPIKSPAQKRLMEAAAHTEGGYGGVPQSVGKKYLAGDEIPDWLHGYSQELAQDGVHAPCNGAGCDGCSGTGIAPIVHAPSKPGLGVAMDEAFDVLMSEILSQAEPTLAFDRAPDDLLDRHAITVALAFDRDLSEDQGQRTDDFERMHVKRAPITRAGIYPYYGREIPKGKELGLHPDKVYKLLRHPDEIKKSASTFHNIPLLSKHVPHSADEHDGDITEGTVGSEAEYDHPYLYNSLAVWTRDGRDYVDKKSQKELSAAYSYDADMTPGAYEDQAYDGVMRNMKGNHVCMVKKGRSGPDVALDEALETPNLIEEILMSKKTTLKSMKATAAYGALVHFLKPKLAMDAAMPNIAGALGTFEPGKFKEATPTFLAALKKSLGKVKLAQDADLAGVVDGVQKLMASIGDDKMVEDEALGMEDPNEEMDDDVTGDAGGGMEAVMAYLKEKGVPDDIIAGMPGMEKPQAEDEFPPKKKEGEEGDNDKKDKPFDKGAMDRALKDTENKTIARMNAISEAKDKVRPIVGALTMAFDSAEGVYRKALTMQGKDAAKLKDLPLSALEQIWDMLPVPGTKREPIAQDSASDDDYSTRFPNAAKVGRR